MARTDFHLVNGIDEFEQQFRSVMRRLAGGVSIITAGQGNDITGISRSTATATSISSPWSALPWPM
jgi:flavin reductase (DIM6/NTAB) family NADH-FMN oxidoreductase RutF